MQKVLTAAEMREVDRLTTEKYGIPSLLLMENAAYAAARVIAEKLGGSVAGKSFLILCGKGNNGGDGAALGRILWTQGAEVHVVLIGEISETKKDSQTNSEIAEKLSGLEVFKVIGREIIERNELYFEECNSIEEWEGCLKENYRCYDTDILVDALFGTGLTKPLSGLHEEVCSYLRGFNVEGVKQETLVVSLDIPSGLNADKSTKIGVTTHAHLTVTFTAPKPANVLPPASHFNGELITVNIGSPPELIDNSPSQLFLAEKQDAQSWLWQTKFTVDSYKKTRGHALIIAGSKNMTGAAVLCGDAAMQSGVGLVTIATPEAARSSISSRVLPEIMVSAVAETERGAIDESALEHVLKLSEKMNAVALGCGLSSNEESTRNFVKKFIEQRRTPIVIDADGLNAVSPFALQGSDAIPLILTPHIGEMRRLLGVDEATDLSDRVKLARKFSQKHHVILVLKGERSLIAAPDGKVVVNPTGNPGIGKAGNGDTLAGIITGFIAQSFAAPKDLSFHTPYSKPLQINAAFDAVVAALYIAGMAGDIAAKKVGMRSMTASDVRTYLGEAFRQLENE